MLRRKKMRLFLADASGVEKEWTAASFLAKKQIRGEVSGVPAWRGRGGECRGVPAGGAGLPKT
jgi:hypothetical protein